MTELFVEIVTPESLFFSDEADHILIPGILGEFGVLPSHSPVISNLVPGIISVDNKNGNKKILVTGGFAEVTNSRCTILAEEAFSLDSLSINDLEKEIDNLSSQKKESDNKEISNNIRKKQVILEVLKQI